MYKDYYLFDTPYLFLNSDEVYDIGFGGEAGEKIMEGVEDVGLRGMAMWENGFRNYTNDKSRKQARRCKRAEDPAPWKMTSI